MATPLPSASKPRRSRQSFTPSVPVIDKAHFTTPSAKQWEEGESLESITEGIHEIGLGGVVEEEEGGDGDVEHMPPRSIRESQKFGPMVVGVTIVAIPRQGADGSTSTCTYWGDRLLRRRVQGV